jgi:RNA polymerase sigma factor (sigma-70 family)
MKYLFIDTNILVRVISQGKPGCEVTHFDDLQKLVDDDKATLLLPEVVLLELKKNWRTFIEKVEIEIGKLEKELEAILKKKAWTEIEDVQKALGEFLNQQKEKKISTATDRHQKVLALLASQKVVGLPFTSEINFRGRKRIMEGKMPKSENQAHSDACILETLADFFANTGQRDQHELFFCSENVGDFGLVGDDRHIIHPLHKDDLPAATDYCISLDRLVALIQSEKRAIPPSPSLIDQALQRRKEDEVAAETDTDDEEKPPSLCAEGNCFANRFLVSRYCAGHYAIHLNRMTAEERKAFNEKLEGILRTLTYREREIIKLRWGLGDGYSYTLEECGRIFKISPQRVRQIESGAIRKLQHPIRSRHLYSLLP